jgi:hypothetical protein
VFHKVAVLKEFQLRRSDMFIATPWQKQPSSVGAAYRNYGRVSDCRAPRPVRRTTRGSQTHQRGALHSEAATGPLRPRTHPHSYLYIVCGLFV